MDEQSGESGEEEVMDEVVGESEVEELIVWYPNDADE